MSTDRGRPETDLSGRGERARNLLYLALVAVVTWLAYAGALDNPFVYDDRPIVVRNDLIKDASHFVEFFHGRINQEGSFAGHTRPLPMLALALNYRLGGLAPWGYRATNLAVHLGCVLLAWIVLRRLLAAYPLGRGAPLPRREAGYAALVATAWFAVHPVHSQIVLTVWKRTTALFTLFSLAALWAFSALRGIGSPPPSKSGQRLALLFAVPLCLLLALASKETAVCVPALLLTLELWPRPDSPAWDRRRWRAAVPIHLAAWLVVVPWLTFLFPHEVAASADFSRASFLLTQAKVVWRYVAMIFDPALLAAAYDVRPATSLLDAPVLAGGLCIIAALVLAVARARRAPLVGLAVVWALLALAPTSSFVPGPLLVDEDRCYMAFLLLWGLAGAGLVHWARIGRRSRITAWAIAGVALLGMTSATVLRGVTWSDPVGLWLDALRKYPGAYMAHRNLCAALASRPESLARAEAECRLAAVGPPPDPGSVLGLGNLLLKTGRYAEAAKLAELARRGLPNNAAPERLAGHVEWASGAPARAVPHYERAIDLEPRDNESRLYLAKCQEELHRLTETRRVLESIPANSPILTDPVGAALAKEIRSKLAGNPSESGP